MQYLLSEEEYTFFKNRSRAIDEIRAIIEAEPETDKHGNSKSYAYRFDKTISSIRKVLKESPQPSVWQMPWFNDTKEMLEGLGVRK